MLVTFSGVDCSGKSTQLDLLAADLTARGLDVVRYWYRPGYSNLLDAVRKQVRRHAPASIPPAGPSEKRATMFARPSVAAGWLGMACADMLTQYSVVLRGHLLRGRAVLCDRYLEDSRMDLQLKFPAMRKVADVATSSVSLVAPRPDVAFLLLLPWDEMLRRMEAKNEPFTDTETVRRTRFENYQRLGRSPEFCVLDATRPASEIHASVLDRVKALL